MTTSILLGKRVPDALLGCLVGDEVQGVMLHELVAGKRAVIVGVPGAFTPICTCQHVPEFVANADRLRETGFDLVICVAPNDPWTIAAWAQELDPQGKVTFLADGNLWLARALGVAVRDYRNFLGERSARYLMVAHDGVITRLTVERQAMQLTCTRAEDVLELA